MLAGQAFFASLLFAAVVQFGIFYFVGLSQLIQEEGKRELVTSGIYRFVRHPFYTFALLFIWLSPVVTVNLFVVYLALTVYIRVGIFFEERKLLREFGQEYAKYRAVTPMLLPRFKLGGTNAFRSPSYSDKV